MHESVGTKQTQQVGLQVGKKCRDEFRRGDLKFGCFRCCE